MEDVHVAGRQHASFLWVEKRKTNQMAYLVEPDHPILVDDEGCPFEAQFVVEPRSRTQGVQGMDKLFHHSSSLVHVGYKMGTDQGAFLAPVHDQDLDIFLRRVATYSSNAVTYVLG